MARRKLSEFGRLRRKYFLTFHQVADFFGVTVRTARNWDYREPRSVILARMRERERQLSAFHPLWSGWKIGLDGKLRGPGGAVWTPQHLKMAQVVPDYFRPLSVDDSAVER